jgi:hypothetical protein
MEFKRAQPLFKVEGSHLGQDHLRRSRLSVLKDSFRHVHFIENTGSNPLPVSIKLYSTFIGYSDTISLLIIPSIRTWYKHNECIRLKDQLLHLLPGLVSPLSLVFHFMQYISCVTIVLIVQAIKSTNYTL